jgi:hypothetical protein
LSYLLVGTELFVIAHKVAHVALGHLEQLNGRDYDLSAELEADALAFEVLTNHFDKTMNFGYARASLCEALFLSVTRLWEQGMQHAFNAVSIPFRSESHPTFKERLNHFISSFRDRIQGLRQNGTYSLTMPFGLSQKS